MPHTPTHRARVDDPEKLATDANRSVAARAPFKPFVPTSAPVTQPSAGLLPSHRPEVPFRIGAGGLAPAHVPVTPEASPLNPVTGLVEPRFNLGAAFNQAEVPTGVGGERLVPFAPPTDTTPSFAQAVTPTPAAPPAVAPLATTPAPAVGSFLAAGTPAATAGPQPQGFTLDDLLRQTGPAETGLGALASLGVGSSLVAQNQSEIDTNLGRERAATTSLREGQELESQIASRGAAADVATASAEKIGFENRVNELRVAQGLAPIGDKSSETFKTSVIPADIVSGTPAQILRSSSTGASELRPTSEGGFAAGVANRGPDPIATRIAAIDGFKAANPTFKDATDQEVLIELQRQFDAQSAQ